MGPNKVKVRKEEERKGQGKEIKKSQNLFCCLFSLLY